MASKEPIENPNTPNVNFIGFQKQLREIIKDIKQSNKKTGLKKIFDQSALNSRRITLLIGPLRGFGGIYPEG